MNDWNMRKFSILLSVFLVLGAVTGYLALTRLFPVLLCAHMDDLLTTYTGRDVAIGEVSVEVMPGVLITLDHVVVGDPEEPFLTARQIRARTSLRNVFFGGFPISSLTLEDPRITLDRDTVNEMTSSQWSSGVTTVVIRNGSLVFSGRTPRSVLESASGTMCPEKVEFKAEVLGGQTEISIRRTRGWEGSLSSRNMDLSRLAEGMQGILNMDADFAWSGERIESGVSVSGDRVVLPWSQTAIETLELSLRAQGNDRVLDIHDISMDTPLVRVNGTGKIVEPHKKTDAKISLDLSSDAFEYEKIVDLLPAHEFDDWLETLLTTQIRGGMSRFVSAHYEGSVNELVHFTRFIERIMVIQDLSGQSFSAGFGPERITDISGRVVYGNGDIIFRDLQGMMNRSVIEKVDLSFPGIIPPGLRIGVDAKVDMPARDFLDTWNAVGLPEYALDLFEGVSRVKGGRVSAAVSTYYDEEAEKPFVVKGGLALDGCAYQWGDQAIRDHSGTVAAADFSSPLEISSNLVVGDRRIRSLMISLADPFGEQKSMFQATVDGGVLGSESFSLGKGTVLQIKGTGTGPEVFARADIRTDRFELLGAAYRPRQGSAEAALQVTGRIRPELSLDFTGEILPASPKKLAISGHVAPAQGEVRFEGLLDLNRLVVVQADGHLPLSGEVSGEVNIGWGKEITLHGSLRCTQARVSVNDSIVTLDGSVLMSGKILKSSRLLVLSDDRKITISEGMLVLKPKPVFRGNLIVEGVSLPLEENVTHALSDLEAYTATGHIRFLDLDLYGMPVEEAHADASLKNGVLTLSDIRTRGRSGTIQGSLSTDLSRVLSFDITFALLNANIARFFDVVSEEQDWIRGTMDLSGHLAGENGVVNGTMNLVAKNGRLKKYALASRIFALLNVYKIVQTRDIELTSRNFPYNVITCAFRVDDGVVSFDDFYLDSNSLQLSAVGKYSLKTRNIDAVLGIQPFETIDKTISWIPLLGWVLTGDSGRFLVVSLKVTGHADDPSVQIAPLETISNPIRESIVRALGLPAEIRNEFRKYVPKKD